MSKNTLNKYDLPLLYQTPDTWAQRVLEQPLALLNDHAHLEKKAAANALDLLNRWPDPAPPDNWVTTMTAIASDEIEHLRFVVRLISRRGGKFSKFHKNEYAAGLRKFVRTGEQGELVDRLMVSALIEARSCERFALLAENSTDTELAKLYRGLWASEHGHYLVFIEMAQLVANNLDLINNRWQQWLEFESELIQKQKPTPTMHSAA